MQSVASRVIRSTIHFCSTIMMIALLFPKAIIPTSSFALKSSSSSVRRSRSTTTQSAATRRKTSTAVVTKQNNNNRYRRQQLYSTQSTNYQQSSTVSSSSSFLMMSRRRQQQQQQPYNGGMMQSSSSLFSSTANGSNNDNDVVSSSLSSSSFFADDTQYDTFQSIGIRSSLLLDRIHNNLQLERPTQIQAKAFQDIRNPDATIATTPSSSTVIIGAETGSGKTLAYLLPLIDDILMEKSTVKRNAANKSSNTSNTNNKSMCLPSYDYARAFILVPNKELVQQVVRMVLPLCGGGGDGGRKAVENCLVWAPNSYNSGVGSSVGNNNIDHSYTSKDEKHDASDSEDPYDPSTTVRIAVMPGGIQEPIDFKPFRDSIGLGGSQPPVDIVITTPAALGPLALKPKYIDLFEDVRTIIVDEADMLLDGGYIRALENVLMGFRRSDRLVSSSVASSSSLSSLSSSDNDGHNNSHDVDVDTTENDDDNNDNTKNAFFRNSKTQHVFVAATLPDVGLKSVDAYLTKKFPNSNRINTDTMHNAKHYGLIQSTEWYQIETKKERLNMLESMLLSSQNNKDDNTDDNNNIDTDTDTDTDTDIGDNDTMTRSRSSLKGKKTMVFLNSVDDVETVYQALVSRGINAVPYHAKIPLNERTNNLDRFRRYIEEEENDTTTTTNNTNRGTTDTVPVLVCTDLASRGLDVPGVTAVVQLQFSGNVVSHLHRMGRCGRAGQQTGRGIIFYNEQESELVQVVQNAEQQQEKMQLQQDVDVFDDNNDDANHDGDDKSKSGGVGKVQKAFSRKRGFTKKRKKLRREQQ